MSYCFSVAQCISVGPGPGLLGASFGSVSVRKVHLRLSREREIIRRNGMIKVEDKATVTVPFCIIHLELSFGDASVNKFGSTEGNALLQIRSRWLAYFTTVQ